MSPVVCGFPSAAGSDHSWWSGLAPGSFSRRPSSWGPPHTRGCKGGWGAAAPSALQLGFPASWPTLRPPPSFPGFYPHLCLSIHPPPILEGPGQGCCWGCRHGSRGSWRQSWEEGTLGPEEARSGATTPRGRDLQAPCWSGPRWPCVHAGGGSPLSLSQRNLFSQLLLCCPQNTVLQGPSLSPRGEQRVGGGRMGSLW